MLTLDVIQQPLLSKVYSLGKDRKTLDPPFGNFC
jgi:hypothetical protein